MSNKINLMGNLQTLMSFISGFILGLLLPISSEVFSMIFSNYFLENASHVATIVMGFSALIVVIKFFMDKQREQALFVVEQLEFFRTNILTQFNLIADDIDLVHSNSRIDYIKNFSYPWVYMTYREKILIQTKFSSDKKIAGLILGMLNAIEQLSWSIILHKTNKHLALYVIRDAYVQFIEQFAHHILFHRADKPKQFEGIKKIYNEWAPQISRETEEEILKRITEEAEELKKEGKIKPK